MRSAIDAIIEKQRSEVENTLKFRSQLWRLLNEDDREALLDRIGKGAGYYSAFLKENMELLLKHLAQVEHLSRSKQYADALREIDAMLVKKLHSIAKAAHITTCVLNGSEVTRNVELQQDLARQRHSLVEQVRAWVADHAPRTSTRTGRKRRRKDEEGTIIPPPERKKREKKVKGETYRKTYALFKEGKNIAEIATERGLSQSTIEGHAARGIAEGELDIDRLMPEETRDAIAQWMNDQAEIGLNEARAHFGDRYTYGQLRMVQAWLARQKEDPIKPT